jgi:hypothetical protein
VQELQDLLVQDLLVPVDPLATLVLKVQQLVLLVQLVPPAQLVLVDPQVMTDCVDLLDIKVKKDLEDLLAILVP